MQESMQKFMERKKKSWNIYKLFLAFIPIVLFVSCSPTQLVVRQAAGFFADGQKVFERESDLEIAEQALAGNLKILEIMLDQDKDNPEILIFATQGFTAFATAFVEDKAYDFEFSNEELYRYHKLRAKRLYNRATAYGERALKIKNDGINPFSFKLKKFQKWIERKDKEWVPYIFWTALSLGAAINSDREDLGAFVRMALVVSAIEWVAKKQPNYYFASPLLFLGTYYAGIPAVYGNNKQKAENYFNKIQKLSHNRHLMAKVYMAKYFAVQYQDETLFKKLLLEVKNAPYKYWPEQSLMNSLAKRKAARLLKNSKEYF